MAESRDRLTGEVDTATLYARRRVGVLGIYQDQLELEMALSSTTPVRARVQRGSFGTPVRRGGGRRVNGMPVAGRGRQNMLVWMGSGSRGNGSGGRRRRGRGGSNSVLPSWYPRTPLQDITAVVRAFERRRDGLRGSEAQEIGSPVPQRVEGPYPSEHPPVGAHLKHSEATMTPIPALVRPKRCPPTVGRVPKLLLDITNQPSADSEVLTPQKKLLNSIDTVQKVVKEELQRLKSTSSAKKAEREKIVRTLMTFRISSTINYMMYRTTIPFLLGWFVISFAYVPTIFTNVQRIS